MEEGVSTRGYDHLIDTISSLLEEARGRAARSINAILTATYWEVGCRIVEFEQGGEARAHYGAALLERLSQDLTKRFGRGFSTDNLENMRLFYQSYPAERISETLSRNSQHLPRAAEKPEAFRKFPQKESSRTFPLSWSHYVLLVRRSILSRVFKHPPDGVWRIDALASKCADLLHPLSERTKDQPISDCGLRISDCALLPADIFLDKIPQLRHQDTIYDNSDD